MPPTAPCSEPSRAVPSTEAANENEPRESPTGAMVVALEVRERIGREHALLRSLTRALLGAAKAAEHDEKERYVIREILTQLLDEAQRHFEYEERVAGALLRKAETWGPICALRMAKEHDEQRTTLLALAEDAQDGVRSIDELTEEITWFFRRFEQDMNDEEERLLSAGRSAPLSLVSSVTEPAHAPSRPGRKRR